MLEDSQHIEVLETYLGKDLEYKEYEPLFACAVEAAAKQIKKRIVCYMQTAM